MSTHDPQRAQSARSVRSVFNLLSTGLMLLASVALLGLAWHAYQRPSAAQQSAVALPTSPVSFAGAELRGNPDAPVVLLVFSDFQCPFCHTFFLNTFTELVDQYVKTGQVLVAFRNFPLSIHPLANAAARAARCAGLQGKFWEMHDQLFLSPTLTADVLRSLPTAVGIDATEVASCTESASTKAAIQADIDSAHALKFPGTPAFLVGSRQGADHVVARKRISGARPLAVFQEAIKETLGASVATSK